MINVSHEEGLMGVKPTCELWEVTETGETKWNNSVLQVAPLASERVANEAVSKYRRPRR